MYLNPHSGKTSALHFFDGKDISNNFEAQTKQVVSQIDPVLKRAGGSLANVVSMTVFIKESRYGDRFVEMRKDFFQNGNYPGSTLITVTNFARHGIEIEIQAVGVIGDSRSSENPCSAEGMAKKKQASGRLGWGSIPVRPGSVHRIRDLADPTASRRDISKGIKNVPGVACTSQKAARHSTGGDQYETDGKAVCRCGIRRLRCDEFRRARPGLSQQADTHHRALCARGQY